MIKIGTESGMKAIVLVLLVGLAASAQAQICGKTSLTITFPCRIHSYPLPTVAPTQWEGLIFEYIGTSEAEITEFRIGKESYDAINLRRRYIEEQLSREREYYDYLFLHKEVQCFTRLYA